MTMSMSCLQDLTASLGSLSLTTAAAADELSAPQSLMKYPPLAYLLNALLGCLNFLRECPLLTVRSYCLPAHRRYTATEIVTLLPYHVQVRDDILQILGTFVGEICSFLCEQKLTIRNLGKKYFGDGYMRENLSQKTIKGGWVLCTVNYRILTWNLNLELIECSIMSIQRR